MGISIPQLLIILLIVALLFGTKKLRGIGSDLGSALKGFRNAMKDEDPDTVSQTTSEEQGNIIDSKSPETEKEGSPPKQEEQA